MASIRITLSLKFDDSSELYNNLVVPKRDNRTLTTLIVNLLTAYHENDEVRQIIESMEIESSPFAEIKKQIERIHLEYSKTIAATSMLSNHVKQSKSNYEKTGSFNRGISNEESSNTSSANSDLSTRVAEVEKVIPSILDKLELITSFIKEGNVISTTSQITEDQVQKTELLESSKEDNDKSGLGGMDKTPPSPSYEGSKPSSPAGVTEPSSPAGVTEPSSHAGVTEPSSPAGVTEPSSPARVTLNEEKPAIADNGNKQVDNTEQGDEPAPPMIFIEDEEEESQQDSKPSAFSKALKSIKK